MFSLIWPLREAPSLRRVRSRQVGWASLPLHWATHSRAKLEMGPQVVSFKLAPGTGRTGFPWFPSFPVVQRTWKELKSTSVACTVSSPRLEKGFGWVVLLKSGRDVDAHCSWSTTSLSRRSVSFVTGWQQRRKDPREAAWPWPAYSPMVLSI